MKNVWFCVSFAVLTIAKPAAADAPEWCKTVEKPFGASADIAGMTTSDDAMTVLVSLVNATCWPDSEGQQRHKEVDKTRQKWSKRLDLTEADWADVAYWSVQQASTRQDVRDVSRVGDKVAHSALSPIDQYSAILGNNGEAWYTYLVDELGPKLSETGRLAYMMEACVGYQRGPVEWAMCQPDIARLDRKKLVDELRADTKHNGMERIQVRLALDAFDARLGAHAAEVKAQIAKDPVYGKMFELAEQTRKDWDTIWQKDKDLFALVAEMDDAEQTQSRKAFTGCDDKTWPAFEKAVAEIPAKKFEGFSTKVEDSWAKPAVAVVIGTLHGYLASVAHYLCHKGDDKHDVLINALGGELNSWPGFRGPRSATLTAIMQAGYELDDRSAKLSFPSARRDELFRGDEPRGAFGTLASLKPKGKDVTITFAAKFEKQEDCLSEHGTNRISQIESNGTILYENVCTKWGVVAHNVTPQPQTVDVRYSKGLTPGMNVIAGGGVVFAGWPKGKKTPSVVFGVPVK